MEVYEEIDALKTLEINPVRYLAMPRLIACLVGVPMLMVFTIIIGIAGGGLVSSVNPVINVPFTVYYDNMVRALGYQDILKGLLKATVFGGIIAQVGCYVGFQHQRRGQGDRRIDHPRGGGGFSDDLRRQLFPDPLHALGPA